MDTKSYVYQVFTTKGYFGCQVLRWRSITLEMHLKEVAEYVFESRPATLVFIGGLYVSLVGEDPLSERPYDLDSVAGVLKLYFRTLEKPLFPSESNSQLLEHARK